ncbi:MAG: hypothetical protein J5I90_10390 [Caldilineales bacterium]|nr:hypothetical protein [Caldilineales bacterium]
MNRLTLRHKLTIVFGALGVVLVVAFALLWLTRTSTGYPLQEAPLAAAEPVPGVDAAQLVPRPEVPEELRAVMNVTRGRPPSGLSDAPGKRWDWFWDQRSYPLDTIPVDADLKAIEQANGMVAAQSADQSWQSLGPNSIDNGLIGLHSCDQYDCGAWRTNVSGRTKVIVFNPSNPNTIYIATAVGGIWKSTDGGASYTPITNDQPSHAFHSFAIDPTNPNILYAGTGELQGYYGVGLLKSTNGGQSWTLLGESLFKGLVISGIAIHPTSPNTIYVATSVQTQQDGPSFPRRGVFRSTNGGQNWTELAGCDQCYGISDLIMEDSNPQVIYIGVNGQGILKSTDGGSSWAALTNGLPDRGFDRVELANGRGAQAGVIYAGFDARVSQNGQVVPWGLIYKSTDHGQSWQLLPNAPNYCSSQCGYDNIIAVSPTDANTVYIGGSLISGDPWKGVVHKTTNGGQSWQDVTPGTAQNRMVHPDMHAIAFKPGNPQEVWVGNDGGVFRTTNGGQTWEHRNTGLSTLQFINIGIHPTNPNIAFGGLQDNAKAKYDGTKWVGLDTGDGGYSEIDPFNPSIWYSTRYSIQGSIVQFQRNDKGGTAPLSDWVRKADGIDINDRVDFYVPFTMDSSTQGVLYLGTHRLYRTGNRGDNWQPISGDLTRGADTRGRISTLTVAPNDPQTIYTGSSDGIVAVTKNGGGNWTNATGNLPNRWVSDFAVSSTSANTVYVAFNGYNTHTPSTPGHVFKSTNGGSSWQNISSNLPDIPALSIALDPQNPGHIYLGTDVGVFRSTNDGGSWAFYNAGLATVPVTDLEMNKATRQLWAGTGGRGVFRLNLGGANPTATPTSPPLTRRLWLPAMLRSVAATATPPPSGPAPGDWAGDKAEFGVTSDQKDVWNVRIRVPVPGCDTWISHPAYTRINQNSFSFEVDLKENGFWRNQGSFGSGTQASGTATLQNVYFGTSCGSWSGQVSWTAVWQGGGSDPTVTPTPTQRPATATPSSRQGIYGQVFYRGVGVQGLTLWLRQCPNNGACDFDTSKVMQTVTDANGYYEFRNAPTLPAGNYYFVYYFNHGDGGNQVNDNYLWRWFGPDITSYAAGSNKAGGNFEIEDITLTGPRTEQTSLPATFTWDPGARSGQRYAWELFDAATGASVCYSDPSTSPNFQLTSSWFASECSGSYGKEYGWFAWAIDGTSWNSNQGFGDSYYYWPITFTGGGGATATPTRTPTATPQAPTSTPTTAPASSITGRVTAKGANVAGVVVQLLGCDPNCAVFDTTTTSGNGSYAFTGLVAPGAGESYRVRYINGANGGNALNPNYLAYWVTRPITSLSAQDATATANLDIGDVALTAPPHQYAGFVPVNFTWQGRGIGSDRYTWAMSFFGDEICSTSPGTATNLYFDLAAFNSCGLFTFVTYDWYVWVTDSANFNNGLGLSYYYRSFMITGTQGARERRMSDEVQLPSPPVRDLPAGLVPEVIRSAGEN